MIKAIPGSAITGRIVTVTLNPVFDRSLFVPDFAMGGTFIVENSATLACGKGVNVSRALKNVAVESTASGILPRVGMEVYLELLDKEDIAHDFLVTEGVIRTNVTIVHGNREAETHLRERGPKVPRSALQSLKEKLRTLAEGDTVFVFSGSLPEGFRSSAYRELIDAVGRCGCRSFLDTSGDALKEALSSRPYLIAPNLGEVRDALGYIPDCNREIRPACSEFHDMGIEHVMITRGRDGVVLSNREETVCAGVEVKDPVNAVGSGDAALAGSILGILGGSDIETVARLACAFGAANTLVSGAGLFRTRDLQTLFGKARALPLE
jgi:1-phosphofructokinase family hexose kinase